MADGADQPEPKPQIDFSTFQEVDVRVGTVTAVDDFPEARTPAYKLWIDFGPQVGRRQTSAQLTAHYTKADLEGRQVAALINIPRKRVAGFASECLVLGFADAEGGVVLIGPDRPVPDGNPLH
ncbi:tRNA-binding protein [Limimonas halophila]|uniref:tRNA-binding protein n=1 Tax=Limimonas halophila TaxID=1082479 RepID=A0A1G7KWX0_9PROT|nr:tRNA-binding protein [Limimonas halophila]SDF41703.1 tRNA-binding protein [Limimonas halophila]